VTGYIPSSWRARSGSRRAKIVRNNNASGGNRRAITRTNHSVTLTFTHARVQRSTHTHTRPRTSTLFSNIDIAHRLFATQRRRHTRTQSFLQQRNQLQSRVNTIISIIVILVPVCAALSLVRDYTSQQPTTIYIIIVIIIIISIIIITVMFQYNAYPNSAMYGLALAHRKQMST